MHFSSPHSLESYLQSQESAGSRVDSGAFTLDRAKALQKIAEHGSPFDHAWVVELGRAAKLLGAGKLHVYQQSKETFISFHPSQQPEGNFEQLFFDPSRNMGCAGTTALRRALWLAGLGEKRPFQLTLPGKDRSLLWNGTNLLALTATPAPNLSLTVSQRTTSQGQGVFLIRNIQSAIYSTQLLSAMRKTLYPLPFPVMVDNRPISGWGNSETHGYGAHRNPLKIAGFDIGGPPILPPPESSEKTMEQHDKLRPLSHGFKHQMLHEPQSVVVLLTAHGGLYQGGKSSTWRSDPAASELFWVKDGVVTQREKLNLSERCVSLAIHVCADDIPTDITGFGLQEDGVAPRRQAAMRKVDEWLQEIDHHFHVIDQDWYRLKKRAAAAAVVGGVCLKFVIPPLGVPLAIAGVIGGAHVFQGPEALCEKFEKEFESLRKDFSSVVEGL